MGWTTPPISYFPIDGACLSYFSGTAYTDAKRIAYLNGSVIGWWLRSPFTNNAKYSWLVTINGDTGYTDAERSYGIRPTFILQSDTRVAVAAVTVAVGNIPSSMMSAKSRLNSRLGVYFVSFMLVPPLVSCRVRLGAVPPAISRVSCVKYTISGKNFNPHSAHFFDLLTQLSPLTIHISPLFPPQRPGSPHWGGAVAGRRGARRRSRSPGSPPLGGAVAAKP